MGGGPDAIPSRIVTLGLDPRAFRKHRQVKNPRVKPEGDERWVDNERWAGNDRGDDIAVLSPPLQVSLFPATLSQPKFPMPERI